MALLTLGYYLTHKIDPDPEMSMSGTIISNGSAAADLTPVARVAHFTNSILRATGELLNCWPSGKVYVCIMLMSQDCFLRSILHGMTNRFSCRRGRCRLARGTGLRAPVDSSCSGSSRSRLAGC